MEKVRLPREVAEAIDVISRMQNWKHRIMECMYDDQRTLSSEMSEVKTYFHSTEGNGLAILTAIVNGYEVEQTPEEKVREFHDTFMQPVASHDLYKGVLVAQAIRDTLDILNIKIEGVNA